MELSKIFNLDPLNTISSGSLLIALNNDLSNELIKLLEKNNVYAEKIGKFLEKEKGLRIKKRNGKIYPMKYTETDEIIKIF